MMRHPIKNKPERAAFTLVELLVVISIIALLMALVLPMLGRARVRALDVDCSNNLRQIGAALYMYALETGSFPGPGPGSYYWDQKNDLIQALQNYVGQDEKIWFCKRETRRTGRDMKSDLNNGYPGYYYWAFDAAGGLPVDATTTTWNDQGWNSDAGTVLMSDRFYDANNSLSGKDEQFHGSTSYKIPLTEPGTHLLLSGGAVVTAAPKVAP